MSDFEDEEEYSEGSHNDYDVDESDQSSTENNDNSFQIISNSSTIVENVGSVTSQLKTWDQLMAARIKLQQVMKLVNSLSIHGEANITDKDLKKIAALSVKRIGKMQEHLTSLSGSLLSSLDVDSESKFSPSEEGSVWESVLEQWWQKTCIPQPDKKASFKSNFNQLEESPVKYAMRLMADKQTLVRRTQLKRLDYRLNASTANEKTSASEEYDHRVFDDSDFYQVLVRDVISRKLAGSNDPSAMARTMLSGEKLTADIIRPKKQLVDRRASKGRKIRYNIMSKLVNYMGPDNKISWTDQQRDELFKSLFQQI